MLTLPMLIVLPVHTRKALEGSAMVWPAAYSRETAVKIEKVPRVTMNGGRFSRVTSAPLSSPVSSPTAMPISSAIGPGTPWSSLSFTITRRRQHHRHADGQVDAGGQDDHGLPHGECGDDRDLLHEQGERLRPQEVVGEDPEHDHGHDQHDERAQRRVAVQQVLDPLGGRVPGGQQVFRGGGCLGGLRRVVAHDVLLWWSTVIRPPCPSTPSCPRQVSGSRSRAAASR